MAPSLPIKALNATERSTGTGLTQLRRNVYTFTEAHSAKHVEVPSDMADRNFHFPSNHRRLNFQSGMQMCPSVHGRLGTCETKDKHTDPTRRRRPATVGWLVDVRSRLITLLVVRAFLIRLHRPAPRPTALQSGSGRAS